jgi:MoaA/NifB/PqqE/SkfB family radical SAM enzyme
MFQHFLESNTIMINQFWKALDKGILHRNVLRCLQEGDKLRINAVQLYVSDRCPLKCRHCFLGDVRSVDRPLFLQEWQSAIDQFVDLGVQSIHLAGREPFTEHITLELLAYLSKKKEQHNLYISTISNGLNCRKHLNEIQHSGLDHLDISIDGLESTHDFMRGKGTFKHIIKNLKEIILALGSERVSTATVLHKANIHQIPEIIDTLSQLGIRNCFFQPVAPVGSALAMTDLLLEGREYGQAILETKEFLARPEYQALGIVVRFTIPSKIARSLCQVNPWFEQELLAYLSQEKAELPQVSSYLRLNFGLLHVPFKQHCVVTADGYIVSDTRSFSNYVDNSLGSVRQHSVEDLLSKARQFAIDYLRRDR